MHLLEDGRSFVDLVEHAHVDGLRAVLDVVVELVPVELAAEAETGLGGVPVRIAVVRMHVAVAAAREHVLGIDHHVAVRGVSLRGGDVLPQAALPVLPLEVVVAEPADVPGNEGVALLDQFQELAVFGAGDAVVSTLPPVGGTTQHDAPALGLQLFDVGFQVGGLRMGVVVEGDAPEGQHRLSVLVEIVLLGGAVLELVLVHQRLRVLDHRLGHLRIAGHHAAHVVHHGDGALVLVGPLHRVLEHLVEVVLVLGVLDLAHEPLHEHAVDSVVLHPLEVRQHRGLVIGREHRRVAAVGQEERRGIPRRIAVAHDILLRVLGHIGPEVDGIAEHARAELLALPIVVPSLVGDGRHRGAVARRPEPALVAGHHQPHVRVVRVAVLAERDAQVVELVLLWLRRIRLHPARDHLFLLLARGDRGQDGNKCQITVTHHYWGISTIFVSDRFQLS